MTSITIPDSVTSIGEDAFIYCPKLADENNFVIIRDTLYGYYGSDAEVTVPAGVAVIGNSAFYGCEKLESIKLPDKLTMIGESAFHGCTSLVSVNIPEGVTNIRDYTFCSCKSLKSVVIPYRVTEIGIWAFTDCSNLLFVNIPESVTNIKSSTFQNCENLTLRVKKGSYGAAYASENNIAFKIVPALSNKSSVSADSVVIGSSITVNCAASGGEKGYTYAVYCRKAGTTKWTAVQNYKSNAAVTIKPSAAVNYEVRVAVKDATGKIVRKDFTLKVAKKLTNTSKLSADSIRLGEKVKVRCFAAGGTGDYQYAVYYKKSFAEKWTRLRDYGTGNILTLIPKSAVPYDVRVDVKDAGGTVVSKTLSLNVTK